MNENTKILKELQENSEMSLVQGAKVIDAVNGLEPAMEGVLVKTNELVEEQKKTNQILSKEESKPEVQKVKLEGISVVTIKGDKGDKGDKGEQGVKGEQGEKGEQGIQGEKGEKGEKGERGDAGKQGEVGLIGPKGDKGDIGPVGKTGKQGSPDTPEQIKSKLLEVGLEYEEIENAPSFEKIVAFVKQSSKTTSLSELDDVNLDGLTQTDGKYDLGSGGGGGTPASPDTSIQFNNAGSFGGSADFTYDDTTKVMQLDSILYRQETNSEYPGNIGMYITNNPITTSGYDSSTTYINLAIGQDILQQVNDPTTEIPIGMNIVLGYKVLQNHETASFLSGNNLAIGQNILQQTDTVYGNICIGSNLIENDSSLASFNNLVIGSLSLSYGGNSNICLGNSNLTSSYSEENIAIGSNVMILASGSGNIGMGTSSITNLTSGNRNIGLGIASLLSLSSGSNNIGIGTFAGRNISTGSENICLGNYAQTSSGSTSNQFVVGSSVNSSGEETNITSMRIGVNPTDTNGMLYTVQNTGTDIAYGASTPRLRVGGSGLPSATSSLVEFNSTTQGLLTPRMTTAERDAISSPATGLLIYNTTTSAFNFYNGSAWTAVGSGGTPGGSDTQVQFNDGGSLGGDSNFTWDKTNNILSIPNLKAIGSGGLLLEASNGTDIGILGAGNTANVEWYGSHNFDTATANTIAGFGASKTLQSLSTSTYPSLTELSYVKGATSAIQTQIDGKQPLDTQLTDLAGLSYTGNASKYIRVNATENGFELANVSGGGGIDGAGTANELTYWVDSDTLGTLPTSTYPSLTELASLKGVTTVGSNIVKLANPSAVRYLRINSDNTVTARSASDFNNDLGLQDTYAVGAGSINPLDSTTYYIGGGVLITSAWTTSAGVRRNYVPKACNIRRVSLQAVATNAASGESATIAIRVNNTTDYTLTTTFTFNAGANAWNLLNVSGLDIPLSANDYWEVKITTPAWTTNPTSCFWQGTVHYEY